MYQVKFIKDNELPVGTDWAATRFGGRCVLFVKWSCCAPLGMVPRSAVTAIWRMAGYPQASVELEESTDVTEGLSDAVDVGGLVAVGRLDLGVSEDLRG